jgi:hypothetical protein
MPVASKLTTIAIIDGSSVPTDCGALRYKRVQGCTLTMLVDRYVPAHKERPCRVLDLKRLPTPEDSVGFLIMVAQRVTEMGETRPDMVTMDRVGMRVDGIGGVFDLTYFVEVDKLIYVKHGNDTFVAAPGGEL